MKTLCLNRDELLDAVMAADGMSASLDRSDARITVINDDHASALTLLIAQAVPLVVAMAGDVVTDYSVTDAAVTITYADSVNLDAALRTAIVWRTLQLCYAGADRARAEYCASVVAEVLNGYTSQCPQHRASSVF